MQNNPRAFKILHDKFYPQRNEIMLYLKYCSLKGEQVKYAEE